LIRGLEVSHIIPSKEQAILTGILWIFSLDFVKYVLKHHVIEICGEKKVKLHAFLTSSLDTREMLASQL
jgi:hypothetical protein